MAIQHSQQEATLAIIESIVQGSWIQCQQFFCQVGVPIHAACVKGCLTIGQFLVKSGSKCMTTYRINSGTILDEEVNNIRVIKYTCFMHQTSIEVHRGVASLFP